MPLPDLSKSCLRTLFKKIRANLPTQRREEAKSALISHLLPELNSHHHILSFASFRSEIDTTELNFHLAHTNRLLLPKVVGESLKIFHVTNLENDLELSPFGFLQPNDRCPEADLSKIDVVLVPALGFDHHNHRLGYGKGHYDRFLKSVSAKTLGLGFREQLFQKLPVEPTDISLEKVLCY